MTLIRRSPSGRSFMAAEVNAITEAIGYTGAAPLSLTLMEADHTPGLYLCGFDMIVRAVGTGGIFTRAYTYSAPAVGATSFNTSASNSAVITSLGHLAQGANAGANNQLNWQPPIVLASNGVSAIRLNLSPSGVAGSPLLDVYATAMLVGF